MKGGAFQYNHGLKAYSTSNPTQLIHNISQFWDLWVIMLIKKKKKVSFPPQNPRSSSWKGCNSKTISSLRLCEKGSLKILQHHCVFSVIMTHFIPTWCHSPADRHQCTLHMFLLPWRLVTNVWECLLINSASWQTCALKCWFWFRNFVTTQCVKFQVPWNKKTKKRDRVGTKDTF